MSEAKKVELVTLNVTVSKEMHELAKAPADITVSILEKAADGLTVDEIVSSLATNVTSILAAAEGAKGVAEEAKQEPGAFSRAIAIPSSNVLDAAVKYSRAKEAADAAKAAEETKPTEESASPPAEAAPEAAPEAPPAS